MVELRIALLGAFAAKYGDRPLDHFRTRAVQALLIHLVCQRRQPHPREALMTLLWPELPLKSAQSNLRHALYHLRRALPEVSGPAGEDVPFVLADRQTIQVNPDCRFQLDVAEFEHLTRPGASLPDLEKAMLLYRDHFLADFFLPTSPDFENWAQARRTALRQRALDALDRLTAGYIQEDALDKAEAYARRQLEIDNLREAGHRQLMKILAFSGRRPAALTHFQHLCQLLQEELGIDPSAETEALVKAIRSDTVETATKGASSQPVPGNLPAQATPFIGRQAELEELDDILSGSPIRLITILGPGGIGKTRLSLAAAERQLTREQFAHGVFFVPLVGLSESDRIVSAIAEALQLRLENGELQMLSYLRAKRLLLVLDNFEHLLSRASPEGQPEGGEMLVNRLLQAAPDLKILVTSHERLRLQGEQVYPIQGLKVGETVDTDDARALLLQAARRLRPDFEATDGNLPALNDICHLVEGMPLALELAAAWVDLLTPAEIVAEIRRSLDFLSTDLRDVPARHRSMQAIFTASWQRLSGKEQQLLAQATIFRNGFTREAVTSITNASLRDLSVLVNKSLLTFDGINGRYHMHELLRQYAAEQLGENDALRDRHSAYYCTWLVARIDGLTGPEQMAVAHHVQADMPNIRSAIFHIVEQVPFTDLDRELPALAEYYYVCGQYHEGINLFRQIHEGLSRQQDQAPFALFWVSLWLADFHGILNQTTLAEPFLQQAKGLLETSEFLQEDTLAERAFLYHTEGYRLFEQEPQAAVQLLRQSQTLLEHLGNRVWLVRNLIGLARAIRNTGDLDRATATARRGYSVAQATGNPLLQVEARLLLGSLNDAVGNHAKAEAQLMEGVAQVRQLKHPQLLGLSLIYLGNNQMFNGHFEAILRISRECQQISTEMGNHRYQIQGQIMEAESRLHLGQYEQCLALTQEARSLAQAHHFIHGRYFQLFSRLALVQGNLAEARTQLLAGKNFLSKPSLGLGLGFVDAVEGNVAKAWQTIKPEIQWESKQKAPHLLAQLLAVAAYLYAIEGQAELAVTLYASARQYPFVDKSQWFADVVGKQVNDAAAGISPDAVATARERGQKMDLLETTESILNQL